MTKIPIWLDCDPGHDDAVAIILALFHPAFELIGISTTYGNSSVENTTYNALSLLTALHKTTIPVYAGSCKPLTKTPEFAPDIHGESGLEGSPELPVPIMKAQCTPGDINALNNALWEACQSYGEELSIVAVGPLTNMAKFFTAFPQARSVIKKLSIMGGGFDGVYNRGFSEFNIWCDPDAANIIVRDPLLGPKVLLLPLNATHTVLCDRAVQKRILGVGTKLRRMYYELMMFFADSYAKRQQFFEGPPVHDPVAVWALLDEYGYCDAGLKFKLLKLTCVENGEQRGKFEYTEDMAESKVVFGIDVNAFWNDTLRVLEIAETHIASTEY